MEEKTVLIEYVGNKSQAYDNITKSGVTWMGKGDIQEVTAAQAKQLLRFPDQWALADKADEVAVLDVPTTVTVIDEDGDSVLVDESSLSKPRERMTKAELVAFARKHWNKELDPGMSKKLMLDQIDEWVETEETVVRLA